MAELPKRYDPKSVEPKWYQRWMENRDFVANPNSAKPAFSIVMPPPNITGMLTLGDAYVAAVQKVFFDLYRKGLIYRGRRMINWDPAAQTAVSDEKVFSKPQKGNLYFVRYEIVEEPARFLEVATTRPETIMADTAMAFHPGDKRYAN